MLTLEWWDEKAEKCHYFPFNRYVWVTALGKGSTVLQEFMPNINNIFMDFIENK